MKKYSWIVALLLALTLAFVGCPDPKDDPEPPPPPPPPPTGGLEEIEVAFTSDNLAAGGSGATVTTTTEGDGFVFTFGSAGHGNTKVAFKVDLGEAQVRSYEKVTFTFEGISGDLGANTGQYNDGPKGLTLLAAGTQAALTGYLEDAPLVAAMVNNWPASGAAAAAEGANICANGAQIGDPAGWPKDMEIAISPTRPRSTLSGEVWFSIYIHANPVGTINGTSEPTSFKITNVVFVPVEGEVPADPVDIAVIAGVTAPVRGETPVTAITETAQFTGAIVWSPAVAAGGTFAAGTAYTANITLTAKLGFTFTGVEEDFFTVAGATATNDADSGVVSAVFPATAAVGQDTIINILEIGGVTAPVAGATPVATITETTQYTGTVAWTPAASAFDFETAYTATITLTAKTGFTLTGVAADSFTVAGATATNAVNSGAVSAVFPKTGRDVATALTITVDGVDQEVEVDVASGEYELFDDGSGYVYTYGSQYGGGYAFFEVDFGAGKSLADYPKLTLKWKGVAGDIGYKNMRAFVSETAFSGAVTESNANASVSFQSGNTAEQTGTFYLSAPTVTSQKAYVAVVLWAGATGSGVATSYEVYDIAFDAVVLEAIDDGAITLAAPVAGAAPVLTVNAAQFSGIVEWDPPIAEGDNFATSTTYTATIKLTAKIPYTLTGVDTDVFTLNGATTVAYNASLEEVTAVFPATGASALTSFPVTITGATGATTEVDYDAVLTINASATAVPDGYTYAGTQGNNWAMLGFDIDLGDKTLADFSTVTFTFEGLTGDFGYKRLLLLAATKTDGLPTAGNFNSADFVITKGTTGGAGNIPTNQTDNATTLTPQSMTVEIDPTLLPTNNLWTASEVQIAIWINASAASYTITNITFNP